MEETLHQLIGSLSHYLVLFTGFHTCHVVAWDFFHQQYELIGAKSHDSHSSPFPADLLGWTKQKFLWFFPAKVTNLGVATSNTKKGGEPWGQRFLKMDFMTVKGILPESSRFGLVAGSETGPTGRGEEAQIVTWQRLVKGNGETGRHHQMEGETGWNRMEMGRAIPMVFLLNNIFWVYHEVVGRFDRGVTLLQQVRWICILMATSLSVVRGFLSVANSSWADLWYERNVMIMDTEKIYLADHFINNICKCPPIWRALQKRHGSHDSMILQFIHDKF